MIDALGSPGSLLLVGGTSDIAVATAACAIAAVGVGAVLRKKLAE